MRLHHAVAAGVLVANIVACSPATVAPAASVPPTIAIDAVPSVPPIGVGGKTVGVSGLVDVATSTNLSPVMIVISMQVVLLLLGTFMESLAMILLTVPIYFPIIEALSLSPIWFGAIMLLNMEMAAISPPFGFGLFVMKAVAPQGTTMMDVYKASVPFLILNAIVMLIMIFFPSVVLWLPSLAAAK